MTNVINLPVLTRLDINPERVLQSAQDERMEGVVVLGYDENGFEYFASSYADCREILWLLKRFEKHLLDGEDAN